MTEHPLGDVTGDHDQETPDVDAAKSIVDTMFNLDEFLSGDVRRAELDATFSIEPHLEGQIESLKAEYDRLTDSQGRPLEDPEQPLADHGRSAAVVMSERLHLQDRYEKSFRSIRLRAMDEDDWAAFQERHKKLLAEGIYSKEFWEDLIVRSAINPKLTAEDVRKIRANVNHAVYNLIGNTAFRVNTMAGVSIPKSLLS